MPTRRQLRALALLTCVVAAEMPHPARADETAPASVVAARRHFEKARADYEQGAYREAVGELEAAHTLDPSAKDLVFNLAMVHEKLGDVDEALRWFRVYATMNLTPQEQERADSTIRRLEGAKPELEQKPSAQGEQPAAPPPPVPKPEPAPPPATVGRIDAATITAAGIAGVALVVGVAMGAMAEHDRPSSTFVTGQDGSYADLVNQTDRAHREAVAADVAFGGFFLGAAAATYLFLSRPRLVPRVATGPTFSAAPLSRGGALRLEGAF